jgi:hypothetical protein
MACPEDMRYLVPDTNVLLECRDLRQLPWRQLFRDDDITIVLVRPVQKELDKFKRDNSPRRSKRARRYTGLLRQLIYAQGHVLLLAEGPPALHLRLAPRLDPHRPKPPELDFSLVDDQIVENALALVGQNSVFAGLVILTLDVGMMLSAHHAGLGFLEPPQDWQLPPEPDEDARTITDLQRQIQDLRRNAPSVSVGFVGSNDEELEVLEIEVARYRGLSDARIKELVESLTAQLSRPDRTASSRADQEREPVPGHPGVNKVIESVVASAATSADEREPPLAAENLAELFDRTKQTYAARLTAFFHELADTLELWTRHRLARVIYQNDGSRPAEGVEVIIETQGDLFLFVPVIGWRPRLPPAPLVAQPPPRLHADTSHGASTRTSLIAPSAIPTSTSQILKFAIPPEPYSRQWSLMCEEFSHKSDPLKLQMLVCARKEENPTGGAIRCRLYARNVAEPINVHLPVRVTYVEADIEHAVSKLLQAGSL